jgi:hypothetical protein
MSNRNGASLHCVAIRVAALSSTGGHAAGNNMYVSDNLVKIDFNPDMDSGPEVADRNAAGNIYVTYKIQDVMKRLNITLETVTDDPELEAILTGGTIYTSGGSGSSATQGYQYPALFVPSNPNGVSIEAWTHNIVGGIVDTVYPYQRWLFPRVYLRKDNRTIDINRMVNTYTGFSVTNPNWGTGVMAGTDPWNYDSTQVAQWCYATVAPTPAVGMQLTTS